MHPYVPVFLALLLAHVLGDFPLQTRRMVLGKIDFRASAYLSHGLVHLLVSMGGLALFTEVGLTTAATLVALAILIAGHLALDLGKSVVIRHLPVLDGALLYSADQFVHAVIVAVAAGIAAGSMPPIDAISAYWIAWQQPVLLFLLIVAVTVFPAGYLIRYMLQPLSEQLNVGLGRESLEGLSNAGLYLGWLERGLLVIAFAIDSFTAVGLIIGAKSVARFPEFQSRAFAEYFLIGTLISVAIAAAGGWALRLSLMAL